MCWLYTGTFGSFIGYSAGFPLLAKTQFPDVDSLPYVFLGPLVGALSRAGTGWISDKCGGARVSLWVFVTMIAAVAGILYFLGIKDQPGAFWGFFTMFMILFLERSLCRSDRRGCLLPRRGGLRRNRQGIHAAQAQPAHHRGHLRGLIPRV